MAIKLRTSITYDSATQANKDIYDLIEILKEIENERYVEEFKNYRTDEDGNVWNAKRNHILAKDLHKSGYYRVRLCQDNKKYSKFIHRMVAQKYIPNPENKPEVNHKDSDRLNNHASNLEWVTSSENSMHSFTYGSRVAIKGTNKKLSKLTDEDVLEMRKIYANNKISHIELGKKFGVSGSTCGRIIIGKAWAHVKTRN